MDEFLLTLSEKDGLITKFTKVRSVKNVFIDSICLDPLFRDMRWRNALFLIGTERDGYERTTDNVY